MAPSKDPFIFKDPFARKSIMASHFQANQPSLLASKFTSYASEAAAHDHGHAHVPDPTYLTLVLEDCLPLSKVEAIIARQVPELEPVCEELAKLALGEGEEGEEEVKICRIRGAVKGWYNVLQDILTDEGDVFYLKRVQLVYRGEVVDAYRPTEHFPRARTRKRKSGESTMRSKSDAVDGKRRNPLGRFLHWRQRSTETPRSRSVG
ncbi:hypothetical protein G7Y79_00012g032850 [Physcia stellaris]|nr:hypothetical protein G7Y79_00012g032850 [Physcia stellaris]